VKRLLRTLENLYGRFLDLILEIPLLRVLSWLWPLAGVMFVGYGAYQIYEPAGWISVGLLIIFDSLHSSWISARGKK
jgi:uncharacterized membrane protein